MKKSGYIFQFTKITKNTDTNQILFYSPLSGGQGSKSGNFLHCCKNSMINMFFVVPVIHARK
ncbi:MAG TPA: hypothetical protein DDW27_00275 [Bacteroidales bacterium]|nr:hypothetical protein [Bacteroidales bacterium]